MRKSVSYFCCGVLLSFLMAAGCPLRAQVSNPSAWESFVSSKDNPVVSDTFRLQTFGKSDRDNWIYQADKNVFPPGNEYALRIPVGSRVAFTPFRLSLYEKVEICTYLRGEHLTDEHKLQYIIFRNNQTETVDVPLTDLHEKGWQFNYIKDNPSELTIQTHTTSGESSNAAFLLDSVYATGNIPAYSLFTGSGDWNDTARWSHLPPLRNRCALIQGETTVSHDTQCRDIAIHSGSLQLSADNSLSLHNLSLYGDEAFFHSNGTLEQSGSLTVHKTFEETGKWYFISFPFDVYLAEIDSRFQQQDEQFEGSGNYFYLQRYNGDRRASLNQASGNWEVVPRHTDPQTPLFEKNKGYLIALDAEATDRTLSFTSQTGDIPEDFARVGLVSLVMQTDQTADNAANFGWFLCGNPLPAPLALSQIEANPSLDGNVYVFDGQTYQTYSIRDNPDYALPPFSAFFLKASQGTEIKVQAPTTPVVQLQLIRTGAFQSASPTEPAPPSSSTHSETLHPDELQISLTGRQLHIENLPLNAHLRLFSLTGQCLFVQQVTAGTCTLSLPDCAQGICLLQLQSKRGTVTRKLYVSML